MIEQRLLISQKLDEIFFSLFVIQRYKYFVQGDGAQETGHGHGWEVARVTKMFLHSTIEQQQYIAKLGLIILSGENE